jgi:hypothetical protein
LNLIIDVDVMLGDTSRRKVTNQPRRFQNALRLAVHSRDVSLVFPVQHQPPDTTIATTKSDALRA